MRFCKKYELFEVVIFFKDIAELLTHTNSSTEDWTNILS